jgi:hypothetical protein
MKIYKLTQEEIQIVNNHNNGKENTIMLICSFEEFEAVDYYDLVDEKYEDYFNLLSPLDEERIIELEQEELDG